MRTPSARLFNHSVAVRVITWGTVKGSRVEAASVETTRKASMQPMGTERRAIHGLDGSATALTAYFPADPGVKVSDQIVWRGVAYHVLGPAYDPAGQGAIFLVDCKAAR